VRLARGKAQAALPRAGANAGKPAYHTISRGLLLAPRPRRSHADESHRAARVRRSPAHRVCSPPRTGRGVQPKRWKGEPCDRSCWLFPSPSLPVTGRPMMVICSARWPKRPAPMPKSRASYRLARARSTKRTASAGDSGSSARTDAAPQIIHLIVGTIPNEVGSSKAQRLRRRPSQDPIPLEASRMRPPSLLGSCLPRCRFSAEPKLRRSRSSEAVPQVVRIFCEKPAAGRRQTGMSSSGHGHVGGLPWRAPPGQGEDLLLMPKACPLPKQVEALRNSRARTLAADADDGMTELTAP
jgi:hypothetical protein